MKLRFLVFGLVFAAAICSAGPALAACGNGLAANYHDIESVKYEKTTCYGVCPSYQVAFSPGGLTYTGRANVTRMGNYTSADTAKFADVVSLLSKLDFYSFKVAPGFVTDVPHFIVEVERCGVTRRIDWPALIYPGVSGTHDIRDLFNGLDRITNSVNWHKSG